MHINKITSERENDMFGLVWKPKQNKKKNLWRPIFIGAFRCRWSHTHRNRRRCCRRSRPHDRPTASAATSETMASVEYKREKYETKKKKNTQRDIFLIRSLRFRFVALRLVGVLVISTTAPNQQQNQHGRNQHAKKKMFTLTKIRTYAARKKKKPTSVSNVDRFLLWLATCIAHHLLSLSIPYYSTELIQHTHPVFIVVVSSRLNMIHSCLDTWATS